MNNIESSFSHYLLTIRGIKNPSSVNEYIRTMPKVKIWFVQNNICSNEHNLWSLNADNSHINQMLKGKLSEKWKNAAKKTQDGDYGFMMATWNRWNEFVSWYESTHKVIPVSNLTQDFYHINSMVSGLLISHNLITRYVSSLLTKPFVILTGLTGSGKTKLAQAFSLWISQSKVQYALIPVGADWTNREPLLGYPNSLKRNHYVKPDSGVLDILIRAHFNYLENKKDLSRCKPYFLILDEMNLSHVERYFADFLSAMESDNKIQLYTGEERYGEFDTLGNPVLSSKIPESILLPKNLFIVGTVNIDETTYMFSPKVLDRASTIEFRISYDEMERYFKNARQLQLDEIVSKGKDKAESFMQLANRTMIQIDQKKNKAVFVAFFEILQSMGAEFGYRTANEMSVLVGYLTYFGLSENDAYDIAIMQKMLPKLHGSRSKLGRILPSLIELCENKYPISFEKLTRMKKSAEENGFASYAEA